MLRLNPRRPSGVRFQRGMSLVELMVGVTVGLFVVAAAALLVTSQLSENRRLLLEAQLQQDLRATADIVTRELRRMGYWDQAEQGVSVPGGATGAKNNPFSVVNVNGQTVTYAYARAAHTASFGFRLDSDGVLRSCQSDSPSTPCNSGWQDLTDGNTVRITAFSISAGNEAAASNGVAMVIPCSRTCDASGDTSCWPTLSIGEITLQITGSAVSDATVTRTVQTTVRSRNDTVRISSTLPPGQVCPS
jgi:type IV pilus assembly protein PilW